MNDLVTDLPERGRVFCALDFETGGFDPDIHALTAAAAVWFRLRPGNPTPDIIAAWGKLLNPSPRLCVSADAMRVQGRTAADIFSGKHTDELLAFHEFRVTHEEHGSPVVVSHNGDFEAGFLRAWARRAGMPDWSEKKGGAERRSVVCTQRLTAYARSVGALPPGGNDFDAALSAFGRARSNKKAHDAAEDARLTAYLLCAVTDELRRFFTPPNADLLERLRRSLPSDRVIPAGTVLPGLGVLAHDVTVADTGILGGVLPDSLSGATPAGNPYTAGFDMARAIPSGEWEPGKPYPWYATVTHGGALWGRVPNTECDTATAPGEAATPNGWLGIGPVGAVGPSGSSGPESPSPFSAFVKGQEAFRAAVMAVALRHLGKFNGSAEYDADDPARVAVNEFYAELEGVEYLPVPEGYATGPRE